MRERNLGEFQGKRKSDFGLDEKDFMAVLFGYIKGGETIEQLHNRAENFLYKIIEKYHKQTILFVGHNGINRALIAVITGKDIDNIENQHNTSVNIFEIDENKNHKTRILNCIKHLNF